MVALLYRLFKAQFNQLAFNDWHQPNPHADLAFAFVHRGKKYYYYPDLNKTPIERYAQIERITTEVMNMLSRAELTLVLDAMEKEAENISNPKLMIKSIGKIMGLVDELKRRHTLLIHPELWFALASAQYICEDQDPTKWDAEYEDLKAKMFRADIEASGGLHDFFTKVGFNRLIPSLPKLSTDFDKLYQDQLAEIKALTDYLSSTNSASTAN